MPRDNTTELLDQLDELKNQFTPAASRSVERLLEQLSRKRLNDTDSLVRYHETPAVPACLSANVVDRAQYERELRGFSNRVVVSARTRDRYLAAATSRNLGNRRNFRHRHVQLLHCSLAREAISIAGRRSIGTGLKMRIGSRRRGRDLCRCWKKTLLLKRNVPYREWLAAARRRASRTIVVDRTIQRVTKTGQGTRRTLRFATALRALDAALQRLAHRHARARQKSVLSPRSFDSTS